MKKRDNVVHMYSESWYLDKFDAHECCDCGLTHAVEYKVEKGRILTRWRRDDKATARVRKDAGIKVTRAGKTVK